MKKTQHKNRVVIVGGGFGGVKTALELANKSAFEVTLISNTTNFEYHGALYRTATGNSPEEVVIPLREIFEKAKNVNVVLDKINRLHSEANNVRSETGTVYEYDTLVLALGNEINYFKLENMDERTHNINTIKCTIALRHELSSQFRTGKEKSVVIIGGGPSGVELAGEISHFAEKVAAKYGKKFVQPKVQLIEGADRLLAVLDPVLSARVYKQLKKLGVEIHLGTSVNACEEGKVCLSSGDIDADVIVWTAGSRPSVFYENNAREFKLERGKVMVDNYLRAKGHKNIFVVGDNAATQYSGMAQTALYDAKYVAKNLVKLHAKHDADVYIPKKPVYTVPVGKGWAVLQTEKHQLSGYRAWVFRRRADLEIFKNFEPYKQAVRRWRDGNRSANY